jgi:glucose-6-phosphate isomerase
MPHLPLVESLVHDRLASRIAARDLSAFTVTAGDDAAQASVSTRLGWLRTPGDMAAHADDLAAFGQAAAADGLTDIYLLGMGGSSLCAEVLRDIAAPPSRRTSLTVLDTTDERTIRGVTESLAPAHSLFIVASKSGSTVEVTSLERHFWSLMADADPARTGRHFVAITDQGTTLEAEAGRKNYRRAFINPSDIGGRYSALSLFGLVPAALLGVDLRALLASGALMAGLSAEDTATNPALTLGAFLGQHASAGRDKLTLLLPPVLAPLGVWIEQLIAESTGKHGRGILPVVNEPPGPAADYGHDRMFVALLTGDGDVRTAARRLEDAGHPVLRIETTAASLGSEFFRWEFATAVAGAILGVNPFDEPNVREAKQRTAAQLDGRRQIGTFRIDPPFTPGPGYSRREHRPEGAEAPAATGRYLAILDYLPAEPRRAAVIERLRGAIRQRSHIATTHGVGPRYLHSTGQYHKGGPNTGLFLLLTAADASATPVPGADYTFSALKYAQALGDFDALAAAGREVIHYHFEDPTADFSADLEKVVMGLR